VIREHDLLIPGMVVGATHGYLRNHHSVLWALVWAAAGYSFPPIVVGVALYQGFGKPKEPVV